jgi:hypothetical protein
LRMILSENRFPLFGIICLRMILSENRFPLFGIMRYLIASGLVGEPTAPVIGIAGATNMNS